MKLNYYVFFTLIIFLFLVGCEMAPTNRMGVIELKISSIDGKDNSPLGVSKYLSPSVMNLVIITYPSYSDGVPSDADPYTLDNNIYSILDRPETQSYIIDLNSTQSTTISDLIPGDWTFILLAYDFEIYDLIEFSASSCSSYLLIKDREIIGGYNYIDANLTNMSLIG